MAKPVRALNEHRCDPFPATRKPCADPDPKLPAFLHSRRKTRSGAGRIEPTIGEVFRLENANELGITGAISLSAQLLR
jgi:hypothetical protein